MLPHKCKLLVHANVIGDRTVVRARIMGNLPITPGFRDVHPFPNVRHIFWTLSGMPKSVPKDMSNQFRVYIVPSDIKSTLDHLRSKVGLTVLEETAPGPKPIEVESPVRSC